MDMFGKSMHQEKVQGENLLVNVLGYPDGLYLVKLKTKDQVYTAKFLKSSH
jgi:hypothetical protein